MKQSTIGGVEKGDLMSAFSTPPCQLADTAEFVSFRLK
jgi:hypothetical protein